jgi:hypothetical protein
MPLFRWLHPAEKDELCRCEMGEEALVHDALAGTEQGIPELAGAVGEAGNRHSVTPADSADGGIITLCYAYILPSRSKMCMTATLRLPYYCLTIL